MKATFIMAALASAFFATSQIAAYAADDADDAEEVAPKKSPKFKKTQKTLPAMPKMSVSVGKFENRSTAKSEEVKTIRDRITGLIVSTHRFEVFERDRIKDLLKAQLLAEMGVTAAEDGPSPGKMKSAGLCVYGTVLSYGHDSAGAHGEARIGPGFKVELQIRIANVKTGMILADQIIQSSSKVQKVASGDVQQKGNWEQQAMSRAVDAACRDAVFCLLDLVCPVRVLAVGDEDITIDVNRDLVNENDVFNVYAAPEYEEDPNTHAMIPVDGKQIGRVVISEPGEKSSKAEPTDWFSVRGKKMKACDVDSIEKGMFLRKVSFEALIKEKKYAERNSMIRAFENVPK